MLVRRLSEIDDTVRDVHAETWKSRRLLLASDGQRVSLHDTILYAGTETTMEYANHVESVYCIGGTGTLLTSPTAPTTSSRTAPSMCSTATSGTGSRPRPTCA